MALILCPECGREISDKAISCPSCGYPMAIKNELAENRIDKTVHNSDTNSTVKAEAPESIKEIGDFSFTDMNGIGIKLEKEILTITADNGEVICSDKLENYYLVYYKACAPIIGKIRWEVVIANDNSISPIYLVARKGENSYKKLKSLCKIFTENCIIDLVESKRMAFDYATNSQERTGDFKPLKLKSKLNYCLLVAFVLGVAYSMFILYYFATYKTNNEWEALGAGIAMHLLTPHLVCTVLATIFNGLGVFFNRKGFALTGAILYSVAIILFPIYWMFVVCQAILSFVGFSLMCKASRK